MAAGLLGTAVGIGLSPVLGHDPTNFIFCFCGLSAIHQGCNYVSLKSVALKHLNRHRLLILIEDYCSLPEDHRSAALTPDQVAAREVYFPLMREDDSGTWLAIGGRFESVCPGGLDELRQLRDATGTGEESYLVNVVVGSGGKVQLSFLTSATGEDLMMGLLHAFLLHRQSSGTASQSSSLTSTMTITSIRESYAEAKSLFPQFVESVRKQGWRTDTALTNIEPSGAFRFTFRRYVE